MAILDLKIATTVVLGMGITYGNLLYCHGDAEGNVDRKISTLEYNNRKVYDWFNNTFTDEFVSPYLNIPPITFDDRHPPHKRARYTPDPPPSAISVASENYFSTLTIPYNFPYLINSNDPNTIHVMRKYFPSLGRLKRGYLCRKNW